MNLKRFSILILSLLLVLTATVIPTASVLAAESNYDYSRTGSYFNTTFTSADVLELIGYELSEGERAYLDSYGALNIRYETVTTQQIHVVTVDGVTRVTADRYSYVAANGAEVIWTPVLVSIDGTDLVPTPSGESYVAEFVGIDAVDNSSVSVKYEMSTVLISASDVNSVLNLAYRDAVALKNEITTYVDNLAVINDYFAQLAFYNKYLSDKLVYDEKSRAYAQYLADLDTYYDALTRYDTYIDELEEYNRIKDNNDSYATNYLKYEADLAIYNQYLRDLEVANEQVQMLHDGLMNTVTYLNRQLYGCIFADLVDEVVAEKDKLTKIGADAKDIDACAAATNVIRSILKPEGGVPYTSLKTQEEKYAFYVNNYETLRDNIIILAKSLHGIYVKDGVRITMHAASSLLGREDYTERLAIFIAQLICLSNAMSTDPIMSSNGKYVLDYGITFDYRDSYGNDRTNVKMSDLLEGEIFVEDIENPHPINLVAAEEPTPPVMLELPTPPTEVSRPTEPTAVAHPGDEPTPVAEPKKPAAAPDTPDRLEIISNATYALLISDLDLGLLDGERAELTESVEYTPAVTVSKSLAAADMTEVTFLDTDGQIITTVITEQGTAVNFTDKLPTKPEDISATYVFDAWVTADGRAYDLSRVTEDVILHPSFRPVYKEYAVIEKGSSYLNVDLGSHTLTDVPMEHFIDLALSSHLGILISAGNVTLTIPYSTVTELSSAAVARFAVFVDTSSLGSYSCSIFGYGADGHLSVRVSGISVSIPCADEIFARDSVLTYIDGQSDLREVSKSYASGMITFSATTRTVYSFDLKYSIGANSSITDKITVLTSAVPGQTVTITLNIPSGWRVDAVYYTLLSDNSRHAIEGDSFVMPYGNIRLGATLSELTYTVKFVSDGKVISEKGGYKYGDTVTVPNNPTKVSDGEYSYTFIGWSNEISPVSGDVTYYAVFESKPLPEVEESVSWFNVLFYTGLTVLILGVLALTLFILNKTGLVNLRGVLNNAKRKFTRVGDKDSDSSADPGDQGA